MNIAAFLSGQPAIVLFLVLIAYLAIGDFLSLKTKAFLPSIFVFTLLVLLTAWGGLIPSNIFELSGAVSALTGVTALMIVVHMGTSMSISDILSNWRVAIMGILAIAGAAIAILSVGNSVFGWKTAVVSAPVVAGGIVASLEMQSAARAIGNNSLVVIAALILAFQSFPGFILTPILLKRVMKKDLSNGGQSHSKKSEKSIGKDSAKSCKIPEKYLSTATLLTLTVIIGVLAYMSAVFCKGFMGRFSISASVFALIYGIIFAEFGFVPKSILNKAHSNGLVLILVIFSAFGILAKTGYSEVAVVAGPVLGNIAIGIAGIFLLCGISAKMLKMSWELAIALGLNCLLGFPLNYQLTLESIAAVTDDPEEAQYLEHKYMPMMLVAGFVTITIGSVVLAGILRNFM